MDLINLILESVMKIIILTLSYLSFMLFGSVSFAKMDLMSDSCKSCIAASKAWCAKNSCVTPSAKWCDSRECKIY